MKIAIVQTGRLGDLWYTIPLATYLYNKGHTVSIIYDSQFENPFRFSPHILPVPVKLKLKGPLGELINQPLLAAEAKLNYDKVIWNQIFPYRWLGNKQTPYPAIWYRDWPLVNFRTASLSLVVEDVDRICLITKGAKSLKFKDNAWVDRTIHEFIRLSKLKPIYLAFGDEPDHQDYPTWRGSQENYMRLISKASCIAGTSTSAHVLGQLLGKPTFVMYPKNVSPINTIGNEWWRLSEGECFDKCAMDHIRLNLNNVECGTGSTD